MGGASGTHVGDGKCKQNFGFIARWIQTTWKN